MVKNNSYWFILFWRVEINSYNVKFSWQISLAWKAIHTENRCKLRVEWLIVIQTCYWGYRTDNVISVSKHCKQNTNTDSFRPVSTINDGAMKLVFSSVYTVEVMTCSLPDIHVLFNSNEVKNETATQQYLCLLTRSRHFFSTINSSKHFSSSSQYHAQQLFYTKEETSGQNVVLERCSPWSLHSKVSKVGFVIHIYNSQI